MSFIIKLKTATGTVEESASDITKDAAIAKLENDHAEVAYGITVMRVK